MSILKLIAMMDFKEIRVKDIPCISYITGSPVNLYLGPKLDRFERKKLREIENDHMVLYMHDIFEGITKESLSYTFPGLKFPEPFSADSIHDTIRESIGKEINKHSKCIISHDGDSFVVYLGSDNLDDLVSYLISKKEGLITTIHEDLCDASKSNTLGDADLLVDSELKLSDCEYVVHELYDLSDDSYTSVEKDEDGDIRFKITEDKTDGLLFRPADDSEKTNVQFNIDPRPKKAEESFDYEMTKAAMDVKKSIEELLLTGFPLWAIQMWLNDYVKRSRLRITRQFRIILVDYNKEIKMGPLPKTVFLFFLRHPNGVRFSCLQDHVEELMYIYEHVSVNDDPLKMKESIDALVDPLNNSINEKCAAIKKAFLLQVNDEIAREYYITSRLAGYKGIILDRSLVEWECEL